MLEAHLNPDLDAASKNHQIISREAVWFKEKLNLRSGMKVLDLGCGPGLYCEKFYE